MGEAELAQLAAILAATGGGGAPGAMPPMPPAPPMGAPPFDPAMIGMAAMPPAMPAGGAVDPMTGLPMDPAMAGAMPPAPGAPGGIPGLPSTQPQTYMQLAQQAIEQDAAMVAQESQMAFQTAAALMGGAPMQPMPSAMAGSYGGPGMGALEADAVTPPSGLGGIAAELMGAGGY